jgi:hypothetical protein
LLLRLLFRSLKTPAPSASTGKNNGCHCFIKQLLEFYDIPNVGNEDILKISIALE